MKKLISIITSITLAMMLCQQMYGAVTDLARRSSDPKPKTDTATKAITSPLIDTRTTTRTNTPRTPSTEPRVLAEDLEKIIEDKIATHDLGAVASEHLAAYLQQNAEKPGKRANQLVIITELSKNPKTVIARAQEIANAFDRFLVSSTSSQTNLRTLTNNQVTMVMKLAETMLQNKQGTYGLMIINKLMKKPGFKLEPATLELIKKGTFDKSNERTQQTLAAFIDEATKKDILSVIDLVALVDRATIIGIAQGKINEWNKRIDALAEKLELILKQETEFDAKKMADLGVTLQNIMDRSPEKALTLLAKVMDQLPITADAIPHLASVYTVILRSFDKIKPEQFKTVIAMMPTVVRLEREAKNEYKTAVSALKDAYIQLITNNKIAKTEIADFVTNYIDDKAKDLATLVSAVPLAVLAKEKFKAADEQYNTWLAKIADKAFILNTAAIKKLASIKEADLQNQLNDIATLLDLMKISTNIYSANMLATLIANVKQQQNLLTGITGNKRFKDSRQLKEIQQMYNELQNDLNTRLNWLVSSF